MRARARAAQETERRILDAAYDLFSEHLYDQVTLAGVAAAADVSLQTVIRRFGSKDALAGAVTEHVRAAVVAQRGRAPAGDIGAALADLVEHYEQMGDRVLHVLAQETRVPAFKLAADRGRDVHYAWVDRVFAAELAAAREPERRRRRAALIAACDVHVWKVLRRDLGLSRDETERAMGDLVRAGGRVTAQAPGDLVTAARREG